MGDHVFRASTSTTTVTETERFQLARQDARTSGSSRKSPLGRTDDLWLELDDEFDTELCVPPDTSPRNPMAPTISLPPPLRENGDMAKSPIAEKPPIATMSSGGVGVTPQLHHHNSLSAHGGQSNCCISPSSSTSVISSGNRSLSAGGLKIPPLKSPTTFRKQATIEENPSLSPSPTNSLTLSPSQLRLDLQQQNSPSIQNGSAKSPTTNGRCNGISDSQHQHISNGEVRLQQSLSTPCPTAPAPVVHRKESEYRRFKSEGSTGGPCSLPASEMDVAIDDLSPIADPNTSPHRLNIFQDGVTGGPLTKHSHTEQVMMMHTLKTKLQKYQTFIDKAFQNIQHGDNEQIVEGCTIVAKVMTKAWMFPKISHDLSYALCDYIRDQGFFDILIKQFVNPVTCETVRLSCGRVLEECMSLKNREYIVNKGYLKKMVTTAEKLSKNPEQQRMSLSIMESLFKHSADTSFKLIEFGVLDHILLTCKRATDQPITLRHAALALANLSLYSESEAKKKIIQKKLPDWLFLLASQQDDLTRYYACLAICMLGSSKEMEAAVTKSGTLSLVEPFLLAHQATAFAGDHYKHSQGRPKEWLGRLLPMLKSKCREAKSMAAFHFTMEATIKKDQQKLEVFEEIGAIQALKEVASSPDEVAAKFASEALTIIGEEVPYKLSQQVPCWSTSDVQYWVKKIGFGQYAAAFERNMVDGDLLLLLTEKDLQNDLGIKSGLLRKRFIRELESLKIAADYSSVDESQLDQFLMSLSPELSVYTYQMLGLGLNRNLLPQLTNDMMKSVCGIQNPVHRLKLRQALQDSKHIDDIEVAILSKQIDVFISYRRSTGNQLASLIKVLLQLRGYKVFIDVDKLYAGKFDSSLLKNIQAAKHFILVLTPNSLDRLFNDTNCDDWIHKELRCAFDHQKNVIPIFDQHFEFPAVEDEIPQDIRQITKFNGVRWVHDYQEACIDKVERFLKGELNRTPSINQSGPYSNASSPRRVGLSVKTGAAAAAPKPTRAKWNSVNRGPGPLPNSPAANTKNTRHQLDPPPTSGANAFRSSSIEKRKKLYASVSTVYSGT
ncbi:hypothetical protein QR680_014566 [Steinernema hermaphroditum]|uniref:ADP-ribosyl cyclase/cyclic ADP-ribose hydrolase n=1 Tax=Steinernema hermaphroditum TaxID=289476 RepID=A0AA39IBI5_9BILA|nr:hypothetical protein QR680_014566 [Steinernema hermaphroditum]